MLEMQEAWVDSWFRKIAWVENGNPFQYSCWTEESGWLQSVGLQRVRYGWVTEHTHQDVKYTHVTQLDARMNIFSQESNNIYTKEFIATYSVIAKSEILKWP